MNSINYTPNSNKFKKEQAQEKKRAEKVVTGVVKTKKKNEVTKLADVFLTEDISTVKTYVIADVLIPAIKKAVCDIVADGIHMLLYGDTARKKSGLRADRFSYNTLHRPDRKEDTHSLHSRYSCDDVILETRGEAEEVLSHLSDMIGLYGVASIADLYDLVGKTGEYTDNKYGWTNIATAEPVRVRDGYLLKMPKALPIHNH